MNEVICAEGEIKTVTGEIVQYIETLISNITTYNLRLKVVQMTGIKDELIRAKLQDLSIELNSYKKALSVLAENIQSTENAYIRDLAEKDKFVFPGEIMSAIDALLSIFS